MNHYIIPGIICFCLGSAFAMALNAEPDDGYTLAQVDQANSFIAAQLETCDRDDWLCVMDKAAKRRKP
jgi:hypothetical protein